MQKRGRLAEWGLSASTLRLEPVGRPAELAACRSYALVEPIDSKDAGLTADRQRWRGHFRFGARMGVEGGPDRADDHRSLADRR